MKKINLRSVTWESGLSHEEFAGLWSTAMWVLAVIYLVTKLTIH